DLEDDHDRLTDEKARRQRREETDDDQQTAHQLSADGSERPQRSGVETHAGHDLLPAFDAGTVPPAEGFLGAVRRERETDDESEDEERCVCECHRCLSFCGGPSSGGAAVMPRLGQDSCGCNYRGGTGT